MRLPEPKEPLDTCVFCNARDVLFEFASGRDGFFASSSLSEGFRSPIAIFFIGDTPRIVFGIAEGSSVGLFFSSADCDILPSICVVFVGCLMDTSRLLLLCIGSGLRESSVLLPVPRITTGASRFRKKSSMSPLVVLVMLLLRVEGVLSKLSLVVPALAERPILLVLIELPLRPLPAYRPYPSCPVPAAGPLRCSFPSDFAGAAGSVLVRRVKNPNREVLFGLGAGAGTGPELTLRVVLSSWRSGVGPRDVERVAGGKADEGLGDGSREDGFAGVVVLDLMVDASAILDSDDALRLWWDGK